MSRTRATRGRVATLARVVGDRLRSSAPRGRLGSTATAVAFCFFFGVISLWALATPIWGSPDEPAHAYRAYAAAHGQLYVSPTNAIAGTGGFVSVPHDITVSGYSVVCYQFKHEVTADCAKDPTGGDTHLVSTPTGAARYNPAYYFVVGLPSLVMGDRHVLFGMRLVSAALSAWMLAWALTSAALARRPRIAVSAVLFGLTPMTLFLAGMVNPNGLEITAAAATWVSGAMLLRNDNADVRRVLLRRTAVAASILVLMRPLSPLWLAVIALVTFLAATPGVRQRLFRRDVVPWAGLVAGSGVAAVVWIYAAQALTISQLPHPKHWSFEGRWLLTWRLTPNRVRQQLGVFGWLDTPLPKVDYQWWGAVLLVALVLSVLLVRWRMKIALCLLAAAAIMVPMLIEALEFNTDGLVWQGRYTLPLSIGLAALMAVGLGECRWLPRAAEWPLSAVLITASVAVDLIAFPWAMHRYIAGWQRPFTLSGPWQPPGGATSLFFAQILVTLAGAALALAFARRLWPSEARAPDAVGPPVREQAATAVLR